MPILYIKLLMLSFLLLWELSAFSQDITAPGTVDLEFNSVEDPEEVSNMVMQDGVGPSTDVQRSQQSDQVKEFIILIEDTPGLQALEMPVLAESMGRADSNSYLGIITFKDDVSVLQPLTDRPGLDDETLLGALASINFDGMTANLGLALERATYELKYNGQDSASKSILLFIDSGNYISQTEENSLNSIPTSVFTDISEFNINLETIVLGNVTENNISRLFIGIQNSSIHYLDNVSELGSILDRVITTIESVNNNIEPADTIEMPQTPPPLQQVQTQAQINTTTPAVSPAMGEEEKARTIVIVIAALIMVVTLGVLIMLLYLRMKKLTGGKGVEISEAFLNDIHGITSNEKYRLGKKATMLGRVAGKDSTNLDYIVIPESTIGRRHAVIEYKDYAYWIMDQGSINGTFVNNIPVTSEVRLKQGDIVRLHKFEFEFSIPELDEAGMTKVSNTVLAENIQDFTSEDSPDYNEVKDSISNGGLDLDFGFGEAEEEQVNKQPTSAGSDETLLPGHEYDNQEEEDSDGEDQISDSKPIESVDLDISENSGTDLSPESDSNNDEEIQDETLMPGFMDDVEEDETIRPNKEPPEEDK